MKYLFDGIDDIAWGNLDYYTGDGNTMLANLRALEALLDDDIVRDEAWAGQLRKVVYACMGGAWMSYRSYRIRNSLPAILPFLFTCLFNTVDDLNGMGFEGRDKVDFGLLRELLAIIDNSPVIYDKLAETAEQYALIDVVRRIMLMQIDDIARLCQPQYPFGVRQSAVGVLARFAEVSGQYLRLLLPTVRIENDNLGQHNLLRLIDAIVRRDPQFDITPIHDDLMAMLHPEEAPFVRLFAAWILVDQLGRDAPEVAVDTLWVLMKADDMADDHRCFIGRALAHVPHKRGDVIRYLAAKVEAEQIDPTSGRYSRWIVETVCVLLEIVFGAPGLSIVLDGTLVSVEGDESRQYWINTVQYRDAKPMSRVQPPLSEEQKIVISALLKRDYLWAPGLRPFAVYGLDGTREDISALLLSDDKDIEL